MKCNQCDNEATVHLTQVVEGEVKKVHLCETCAAESGLDVQGPVSITDILLGMGVEKTEVNPRSERKTCGDCGMTRPDFKKSGRLGCPSCYRFFEKDLKPLIRAMHRSEQHTGKVPESEGRRSQLSAEISTIQKQLDQAVASEAYENAAELRDKLTSLRDAFAEVKVGHDEG